MTQREVKAKMGKMFESTLRSMSRDTAWADEFRSHKRPTRTRQRNKSQKGSWLRKRFSSLLTWESPSDATCFEL